ncbi:MAG: DUF3800 domain-containing protein [Candidatus Sabulitectum sp.]|nr:DUF3800 domain-containing protein [Candidatus Sabulitectum sp.]
MLETAYIFVDESGDLNFSSNGTYWFILTAVTMYQPFDIFAEIMERRFDLIEYGLEIEYFHASYDNYDIRTEIFDAISEYLDAIEINTIIINKRKVDPKFYPEALFFPEMLKQLLPDVLSRELPKRAHNKAVVFQDLTPEKRKRLKIQKSKNDMLANCLSNSNYRIFHHSSKSNLGLQIVDYCNWAIYRYWKSKGEGKAFYKVIKKSISSEREIFKNTKKEFY